MVPTTSTPIAGHALVEARRGDDLADLAVERVDDVGRRAGRRHQPDRRADLEAGKRHLRHGRHVRQRRRCAGCPAVAMARSLPSLISGRSELIAPMNMSMRPASRSGIAAVAPRNGTWIMSTPALHLEQLAAEMLRRADADRAEGQLVRRILRKIDELLHRLHRQARRHHHDERHVGHQVDRREVRDRIVDRVARQMRAHGERGRCDHHECARRAATSPRTNRRWCRRRRACSRPPPSG